MSQFIVTYVKLQSAILKKMFLLYFIVIIGLSSIKAQTFIDEYQLSNSQDVTHLRIEYYKGDATVNPSSLTYSLWKGTRSSIPKTTE